MLAHCNPMKARMAERVTYMSSQFLFWVRRVAAVLIFLVTITAALAAGLLTPYLLAARTANIPLLTISAVASFALLNMCRYEARTLFAGELIEGD